MISSLVSICGELTSSFHVLTLGELRHEEEWLEVWPPSKHYLATVARGYRRTDIVATDRLHSCMVAASHTAAQVYCKSQTENSIRTSQSCIRVLQCQTALQIGFYVIFFLFIASLKKTISVVPGYWAPVSCVAHTQACTSWVPPNALIQVELVTCAPVS